MAKPEEKFRAGGVSVAIFKNEGGKYGVSYSATLQRGYYDKKTGKMAYTTSLGINDIPKAILALQKAYEWMINQPKETESRGEGKPYDPYPGEGDEQFDPGRPR